MVEPLQCMHMFGLYTRIFFKLRFGGERGVQSRLRHSEWWERLIIGDGHHRTSPKSDVMRG